MCYFLNKVNDKRKKIIHYLQFLLISPLHLNTPFVVKFQSQEYRGEVVFYHNFAGSVPPDFCCSPRSSCSSAWGKRKSSRLYGEWRRLIFVVFFEVFGHVTSSVDRCNMSQWRIQFPESAILPSRPFEGYEDVVSSAKLLCNLGVQQHCSF